ncbi:Hint domain-containing protein [Pseudooceanicola algae]|uniref:Hint domain-containing protein n=1 Tax=Pseudooceanicola algae TaxID=1537215 RepID=A0A418SF41_9RHOB|nr:Hint domain-containing protein [Pseudooceanicola algae]QPM89296.1 hypothetical protein PSAL_005110 [Pseudooceanicola algae]
MKSAIAQPVTVIPVYLSAALQVVHGVNEGDPLSFADELVPDDIYWFADRARQVRLATVQKPDGRTLVAAEADAGEPGARVHLDCCLTFMSPDGATTEILVLVEVGRDGAVNEVYALPLAPLRPRVDYQLVGIDRKSARHKLAEVTCVSFTRGTQITMASGLQRAIEDLQVGDRVLTRDQGPQEIRWIGHSTIRATGAFAPIVIRAGELSNTHDLVVSPDHRLFLYQREDRLGIGRKEVLVRARHLINGDTITQQGGGFVDYFQLLFDNHQIIYAEGIAAETLLLDASAQTALLPDLENGYSGLLPGHTMPDHHDLELTKAELRRPEALQLLRHATTGRKPVSGA